MKVIKYTLLVLVAYIAGYYSAIIVVDDKVATLQLLSDTTITNLNEFSATREAEKLLHTLEVESDVLNQLINIHENGKPISIAIKDSANTLKNEINRSQEILNNVSDEQKSHIINKINDIKKENGDAIFHYGS